MGLLWEWLMQVITLYCLTSLPSGTILREEKPCNVNIGRENFILEYNLNVQSKTNLSSLFWELCTIPDIANPLSSLELHPCEKQLCLVTSAPCPQITGDWRGLRNNSLWLKAECFESWSLLTQGSALWSQREGDGGDDMVSAAEGRNSWRWLGGHSSWQECLLTVIITGPSRLICCCCCSPM